MIKKIIRKSCILVMIALLGSGCAKEKDAMRYAPPQEELDAMWEELVAFGEEHRDTLNEMSEFFVDAVDKEAFYNAKDYKNRDKQWPKLEDLEAAFTDEGSKQMLERLSPYYSSENSDFIEIRYTYGQCGEYGKQNPRFYWIVYLDAGGEQLEQYLEYKLHDIDSWVRGYKLDEHLYAVEYTFKGE